MGSWRPEERRKTSRLVAINIDRNRYRYIGTQTYISQYTTRQKDTHTYRRGDSNIEREVYRQAHTFTDRPHRYKFRHTDRNRQKTKIYFPMKKVEEGRERVGNGS